MFPTIPGFIPPNKRTIRAPVNPLDKATVVSIFPREIDEVKHTISPGRFIIPPGTPNNPSILVVGPSSWWREVDEFQPLLEIPNSSIQVADSIVKDYCNGIFGCNMSTQMPGLFYVPGPCPASEIKNKFKETYDLAAERQKNWYIFLVKAADSLWARSNGNPLTISDDMRLAAKELALHEQKDWMKDYKAMDMVKCRFCGSLKNPEYPICMNCRVVDPDHPLASKVKFAPDSTAGMMTNANKPIAG